MGRQRRFSKRYRGTRLTHRSLHELLPDFLREIGAQYKERGDLVLAAWPEVIGERLAPMTEAESFVEGILTVRVKNSTLYSLLKSHDRPRILSSLRNKFPTTKIRNVFFIQG
ncbi:DUF721 domain-containing protein [Simkania negevensis]|uniref:DUF721 domain-containing protein n=1 Tax=Simkania negevensis TaxID=83561 RepID=A0ABS3ARH0_9BACT|nr:DUF721 domain-containing protein [Simkania negevensis]